MAYNGYTGSVEFSEADGVFRGRLQGICEIITYEGTSVEELEADFRLAVDDYLDACRRDGQEPQSPYTGQFILRLVAADVRRHDRCCTARAGEHERLNPRSDPNAPGRRGSSGAQRSGRTDVEGGGRIEIPLR